MVPSDASGGMAGVALKGLTVDFHEPGFVASLAQENQRAFWFQMSGEEQQKAGSPWGPANPQALNRYSYVLNNPIKQSDPNGHSVYLSHKEAADYANSLHEYADYIRTQSGNLTGLAAIFTIVGLIPGMSVIGAGGSIIGLNATFGTGIHTGTVFDFNGWADNIDTYANLIQAANKDSASGVVISIADKGDAWGDYCGGGCQTTIISRDTGNGSVFWMPSLPGRFLFSGGGRVGGLGGARGSVWVAGHACTYSGGNPASGNYYNGDYALCR